MQLQSKQLLVKRPFASSYYDQVIDKVVLLSLPAQAVLLYQSFSYYDDLDRVLCSDRAFSKLCQFVLSSWEVLSDEFRKKVKREDLEQEVCSFLRRKNNEEFDETRHYSPSVERVMALVEDGFKLEGRLERYACVN